MGLSGDEVNSKHPSRIFFKLQTD